MQGILCDEKISKYVQKLRANSIKNGTFFQANITLRSFRLLCFIKQVEEKKLHLHF